MVVYTHTHTHTWLYINNYIKWLSIGQARQEVKSLARGFPGWKWLESRPQDVTQPWVAMKPPHLPSSGRANETRHGIKASAASLVFIHHLITCNGRGATVGSIQHKRMVDYKPEKMCQSCIGDHKSRIHLLLLLSEKQHANYPPSQSLLLPPVQIRDFFCKLASFILFLSCTKISYSWFFGRFSGNMLFYTVLPKV